MRNVIALLIGLVARALMIPLILGIALVLSGNMALVATSLASIPNQLNTVTEALSHVR